MFYNFITKCTAKASHLFSTKKYWYISALNVRSFNETLTNDVISFEQPGPDFHLSGTGIFLKFTNVFFTSKCESSGFTSKRTHFCLNLLAII